MLYDSCRTLPEGGEQVSRQPKIHRPQADEWAAMLLRVTSFPTPDAAVTPDSWWKDVMGTEPAVQTIRKGGLVREEVGDAFGGSLALITEPGRVDWRLSTKVKVEEFPDAFPMIGNFVETAGQFVEAIARWAASSPSLARLAFGGTAALLAQDKRHAYELLDALLPAVEIDPDSADFQYRINRRRRIQLAGQDVQINRLSAWTAVQVHAIVITDPPQHITAPLWHAVQTELDINTVPDFGPFPQTQFEELLRSLARMGTEILSEGDVP